MIHQQFAQISQDVPAGNGLRYGGQFIAYRDVLRRVKGLAAALSARGLGVGDPVAVLLPNSPDMFVVAHALFAVGAIAMPLSVTATRAECESALIKANAVAIISSHDLTTMAEEMLPQLSAKKNLGLFVAGDKGPNSLEALAETSPIDLPEVGKNSPALFLLSSGSTGLPKIVVHTQEGLMADAKRTSEAWAFQADDIVFNMLPSNFAMGLLLGVTGAASVGATTVYWHDKRPLVLARQALLETLAAEGVTVIGAVPAMYESLAGASGNFDLSNIRLSFSGGAALTRDVYNACRDRLGLKLRQAYGLTEAIMVAHNDHPDIDATWQSVGRPAGDAEVKIDIVDGGLPEGVGELMVKSSSMMSCYHDDAGETEASFRDGWLLTGDLARIDEIGNLFVVGRSKLLIEIMGYKIDPIEVEWTLMQHEQVAEAVVVGVPGKDGKGQNLKAFVVPAGANIAPDVLTKFLRKRLSVQKVPSQFEFRSSFPKSSTGKIMRGKLSSTD